MTGWGHGDETQRVNGNGTPGNPYEQDDFAGGFAPDAAAGDYGAADAGFDPPQLELGDEDVRLPWLEGDDEEDEDEGGGMGQGLVLVLLGLLAIGVIVGGVFWAMRDRGDHELVADGGVIRAPAQPYKVKPENPGGEIVAGTGDTSFAVAEGQSRQVRIDGSDKMADGAAIVTPAPAPPGGAAAGAQASAAASAPPSAVGGVGVQVGAFSSRDAAEAGWTSLKSQYPPLGELAHRVVEGKADIGTVYRLQAVAPGASGARTLCEGMKAARLSCQVKN